MFSQNDEEAVIAGVFGERVGRFLDIGAADGERYSNTRALALRGWSGVLVEPCVPAYRALTDLYGGHPTIQTLEAAVTISGGGLVRFYQSAGTVDGAQLSTTDPAHAEKWKASGAVFTLTAVGQVSLAYLFERYGVDFDFISIDVEGQSTALVLALPWERLTKLRCVCVEHDGNEDRIAAAASAHGFRVVSLNAENVILAR